MQDNKKHKKPKPKPAPGPKPTPGPTPAPGPNDQPTLGSLTKSLSVVMICRSTCELCNASKEDAKNANIDQYITLKDIDTQDGMIAFNKLENVPEGNISLPIYTSLITKKNHFGYEPIENIIKSLK